MIDSKSTFDAITKLSSLSEKRLLIDIAALCQSYISGEIQNLGHAVSELKLADALTIEIESKVFEKLLQTGTRNQQGKSLDNSSRKSHLLMKTEFVLNEEEKER